MSAAARAAVLLLALGAGACMPWTLGQTAETLGPGAAQLGAGVAALAPPDTLADVLPVPQAWARVGIAPNVDLGLTWALAATFHADAKWRFLETPAFALAAGAGAGVHGIPDVVGFGEAVWLPFASATLFASSRRDGVRPYFGARALFPLELGDDFAATAWFGARAGAEWSWRRWRFGPELGAMVPASHARDAFVLAAFSARWLARRQRPLDEAAGKP